MARMIKAIAVILLIYTIYIYTLCVSKVCHRLSLGLTLALPGASSSLRLFVGTVCRRLSRSPRNSFTASPLNIPPHFY